MKIIRATIIHHKVVSQLFNAYRNFYKKPLDLNKAENFIGDRLNNKDSIILLATNDGEDKGMGFAQIYPTFSSVNALKIYTLNDLYVDPTARNQGVAKALLAETKKIAVVNDIATISLETASDNKAAQSLYETAGYKKASASSYLSYELNLPKAAAKSLPKITRSAPAKGIVVITGVTSGLGRSMVDRFHEQGWLIAGCARSVVEIEKLHKKYNGMHYFESVDVSNNLAVNTWKENVLKLCGIPNLVINNASIVNIPANTENISSVEFSSVMDINVMGSFNVIQAFLPKMKEKSVGTIINMSSYWGRVAEEKLSPYCSSKFAIEGLSQTLARELPKGMSVVSLDPGGGIATPMLDKCAPSSVKESPTPDDWSHIAVPYILSIDHSHNGQALTCPTVPTKQQEIDAKKKATANQSYSSSFWWKPLAVIGASVAAVGIAGHYLLKK